MRSPWKGGSISLRRRRCSPSVCSSSDELPSSGSRMMLRPGAIVFTRSAVNSRLIDSGSERKTTSPGPNSRARKVSPSSARQCSKKGSGRTMNRAVCTGFGSGTSGGSALGSARGAAIAGSAACVAMPGS